MSKNKIGNTGVECLCNSLKKNTVSFFLYFYSIDLDVSSRQLQK